MSADPDRTGPTDAEPTDADPADAEARRLGMRSWRRGTREMDLILGPFADAEVARLDPAARADYAALLEENDQALFAWVTGQEAAPARHRAMLGRIRTFHRIG